MADRPTISVDTTSAQFRLNGRTVTALVSRFCCGRRTSGVQKTKSFGDRIFGALKRPYSFPERDFKTVGYQEACSFQSELEGRRGIDPTNLRHQALKRLLAIGSC
jgi:hypothetical protein